MVGISGLPLVFLFLALTLSPPPSSAAGASPTFQFAADASEEPTVFRSRQILQSLSTNEELNKAGHHHDGCLTIILNNRQDQLNVLGADSVKVKVNHAPTSIRPAFTGTDVHTAQAMFSTLHIQNSTWIFHDGGRWPSLPGSTDLDDGLGDGVLPGNDELGNAIDDAAGEIYDVDGNQHFPAATLRAIGSRCYLFLPVYLFPTLPGGLDGLQGPTPAAPALSRLYWVDSPSIFGQRIFWSPQLASSSSLLEPRFLFGADKNSASAKLQQLANEFDATIYPRITEMFGQPPDIDRDPRIYLLIDDIRDGKGMYRGYFYSIDQQPSSVNAFSNVKELLYIDAFPSLFLQFEKTLGTVAHELCHLITHFQNGNQSEERWVEEGMAQLGQFMYNGVETSNVDYFIKRPDTTLVNNDDDEFLGTNILAHYGNSYLFFRYLVEKYGRGNPQAFMRRLVSDDAQGITGLNNALLDQNVSFPDVFKTWAIANHLDRTKRIDGTSLNNTLWGYDADNDFDSTNDIGDTEHLPLKAAESRIVGETNPFIIQSQVDDTAADYIQITGAPGDLTLSFDGEDGKEWNFAVIKKSDSVDPDVEIMTLDKTKKTGQLVIKNFGTGNTYKEIFLVPTNLAIGGNSNTGGTPTPSPTDAVTNSPLPLASTDSSNPVSGKIMPALAQKGNYVISGSYNNITCAVWPNPIHENELLVAVKSKTGFVQPPSAVITFGGTQRQLTMSGITKDIYLSHFTIADSGEGTLVATGEDGNGLLLRSTLSFSANHMANRLTPINFRTSLESPPSSGAAGKTTE